MSQPPPTENEQSREVAAEVLKDIEKRVKLGEAKYGTRLKTFNGRDALQDLYEELLDAVQYTKQILMEREYLKSLVDDHVKHVELHNKLRTLIAQESNDDAER